MKIKLHQRGSVLLAVVFIIVTVGIVLLGWKIISRLKSWNLDTNHGQGTNAEPDSAWSSTISNMAAAHPGFQTTLPSLGMSVPPESLAHEWWFDVQTSTDLFHWTHFDPEWEEVLDMVATNHNESQRFYRRVIVW